MYVYMGYIIVNEICQRRIYQGIFRLPAQTSCKGILHEIANSVPYHILVFRH